MRIHAILMVLGTAMLLACSTRSQVVPASAGDLGARPSLSVFGFSCELGGQKCRDRRVGREMRLLVSSGLHKTGSFSDQEERGSVRKHLLDVSDMLWTSGGSDILPDLVEHTQADFVAYGRVFDYDRQTRLLRVEITLEHRLSARRLSRVGEGARGNLKDAVADAVEKIKADLPGLL